MKKPIMQGMRSTSGATWGRMFFSVWQPETPEQIRERFARENSDFSGQELRDAAKSVDAKHREQYVKQGYSDNSYRTYEEAAEIARHKQVLRERNQE